MVNLRRRVSCDRAAAALPLALPVWAAWRALAARRARRERTPKSGAVPQKASTQSVGSPRPPPPPCARSPSSRFLTASQSQYPMHTACPTFDTPRPASRALRVPRSPLRARPPRRTTKLVGRRRRHRQRRRSRRRPGHKPLACAPLRIATLVVFCRFDAARRCHALRPRLPRNPAVRCRGFRIEPAAHTSAQPHPSLFPRRRAARFAPSLCVSSPKTPDLTLFSSARRAPRCSR